jgi:hypothetical protein
MTSVDLHAEPNQIVAAAPLAPPKARSAKLVSFLGGFMLTGIFLAFGAAVFVLVGVYGFIDFAKLS